MSISPIGFKGIYKVTLPNVKEATSQQEKGAYTDMAFNTVVLGANNVIDSPRISEDKKSVYFKVDDKNDSKFEAGFSNILNDINKRFNVDMAKKAYIQKVGEDEYNKAPLVK